MICRVLRLFVAIILLAGTGIARIGAQNAAVPGTEAAPAYKVGTVTIKFVGTASVNEQVVRANIQVREGGDLDETMLDRDIRALYKTGLFEFIEIKREEVDAHTYNLVFEVTPKYRVFAVRFEGNKQVKSHRLEREIKTSPNTALDERQVKDDSEKIKDFYQKEGFNQVSVSYSINRDRSTGLGTVIFKIREGGKVKIREVRFVGNAHIKSKLLRSQMDTKRYWMFSWLTDTGRFKDDEFQDDLDKLRDFYREHGYLDVEIPEEKIVFSYPKKDSLVITIAVSEGRQYRIGDVTITGNKLHSTVLLKRVAALYAKTGAVFSPSKVDKSVERIEDYYGKDGYLDTRVRVTRRPNLKTNDIDLEYKIEESEKFNVESIQIEGNTKTRSVVIIRELILGPGDTFDMVRMKISKNRLENTRFFDDVDITPQDTNIPGRRDMRVTVKEGRTGTFTFGAGYSTLERATVFAQIQQTNFDLFNRRSFYQGDGEKFSIKVSIGELSNEAVISFEEPYLFEKVLALGFSLFREQSTYVSTYYQEIQEGGYVNLRKHLFGLIDGILTYQYEVVDIYNVSELGLAGHPVIRGRPRRLLRLPRADPGHSRQDHQPDLRQPHGLHHDGGRRPPRRHGQLLLLRVQGVPEFQGVRHPDAGAGARRARRRHRQLWWVCGASLLRRVLPRRTPGSARLRVPRGEPQGRLLGADRRQDVRHVHCGVLGGDRGPDPLRRLLRRGLRERSRI